MASLLPRFRKEELQAANDRRTARVMLESGDVKVTSKARAGGDRIRLRGIPVQANGVGGTMTGTNPEQQATRERRR